MDTAISAKILFENQLRKVQLTAGPNASAISWDQLTARLEDLFKLPSSLKSFQLTYTDEDGDTILIDSDRHLADVVDFAKRDGLASLRFSLCGVNAPKLELKKVSLVAPAAEHQSDDSDIDPDFVLVSTPGSPRSSSETSQFEPESPIEQRNEISDILSRSGIGTTYPAFQNEAFSILKDTEEVKSDKSSSTVLTGAHLSPVDIIENSAGVEAISDGDATDRSVSDILEIEPTLVKVASAEPSEVALQETQADDKPNQADLISFADESGTFPEVEKVAPEEQNQEENESSSTQSSQPEAEEQPRQHLVYDDLDSFIADTKPLINNILEKLESHPQFISGLLSRFESQLSGTNWGIAVLPPQAPHLSSASATQWGMAVIPPQVPPTEGLNMLIGGHNNPTALPTTNWSGVICDVCNKVSFSGTRYKCAECYDFDMCSQCHENGAFHQHTTFDAVRCINEVWRHIECDGCGVRSFVGKRYKCSVCSDYDLCGRCFASGNIGHEGSHAFVALEKIARTVETQNASSGVEPVTTRAASASQSSTSVPPSIDIPVSRVSSARAPPPLPPYPETTNVAEVRMPGNFPTEPSTPHYVPPTPMAEQNRRSRRAPENRTYASVFEDALVNHNLLQCREMLESMGYSALIDDDVLVPLLERHDGDVGDVVRYLLDEGLIA
ncbi:hypothetical protein BJ742DRAFT_777806 [Cladochytrium replicatum]|nr:hypothetical protein BJ742DRAFT_777806 [Cladochytrium replicatum]